MRPSPSSSGPASGRSSRSSSPAPPAAARRHSCRAARPSSTRPCASSSPRRSSRSDVPLPNVAHMQTRPARSDRREVDLRRLVAGFLRMAPDIAIVGEVRDREALPLLLTLSSGVKGYTTIHAGSARQALTRLRFICQLADTANELPMSALNSLVSESVDVVVHCARQGDTPQVTEVIAVEELQTGRDSTNFTVTDLFQRDARRPAAALDRQPPVPHRPPAGDGGVRRAGAPRHVRRRPRAGGDHRPLRARRCVQVDRAWSGSCSPSSAPTASSSSTRPSPSAGPASGSARRA